MRMSPEERRELIMDAAIDAALSPGKNYHTVTRGEIADRAGVSDALVSYYLGNTTREMPEAILREAIRQDICGIIAQGILLQDPLVADLTMLDRMRILQNATPQ